MSKNETRKRKINYTKVSKQMRVRKKINQRDKNFQLESLIELQNGFNKKKKKSKE